MAPSHATSGDSQRATWVILRCIGQLSYGCSSTLLYHPYTFYPCVNFLICTNVDGEGTRHLVLLLEWLALVLDLGEIYPQCPQYLRLTYLSQECIETDVGFKGALMN